MIIDSSKMVKDTENNYTLKESPKQKGGLQCIPFNKFSRLRVNVDKTN